MLQEKSSRTTGDAFSEGTSRDSLPLGIHNRMESAFGTDVSSVRVHEGTQAQSLGALAFTRGSDLFGTGPALGGRGGQEFLGHEAAHVVQQAQGRVRPTTQL